MNGEGRWMLNYSQKEKKRRCMEPTALRTHGFSQCITPWRAPEQRGRDTEGSRHHEYLERERKLKDRLPCSTEDLADITDISEIALTHRVV